MSNNAKQQWALESESCSAKARCAGTPAMLSLTEGKSCCRNSRESFLRSDAGSRGMSSYLALVVLGRAKAARAIGLGAAWALAAQANHERAAVHHFPVHGCRSIGRRLCVVHVHKAKAAALTCTPPTTGSVRSHCASRNAVASNTSSDITCALNASALQWPILFFHTTSISINTRLISPVKTSSAPEQG